MYADRSSLYFTVFTVYESKQNAVGLSGQECASPLPLD
jgi:hypothetical protein